MIIGVPKETKTHEYRVSVVPAGVAELVRRGHTVTVEMRAGVGSGIPDSEYREAGARIVQTREEVFSQADLIAKIQEPLPEEWALIRPDQVMFTYFHLAADRALTEGLLSREVVAIAYETITDRRGRLPLLTPMSEIGGRMSIQQGAKYLERPMMGRGILLGGIPGVEPAEVLILGDRLRYLDDVMPANVQTLFSESIRIRERLKTADLVIGAVLVRGARCPILVPGECLSLMKSGAVIVDVCVDQGGCVETCRH